MKKIKNVTKLGSKFVTVEGGSVYVRFDFGGFYEWYKRMGDTFSLIDVEVSQELEESLGTFVSSKKPNFIRLDEIR